MTESIKCNCLDKDHDHTRPCSHTGISGERNDWICNWCDYESGNPNDSTRKIHKDFTNHLKEIGVRQ